jgi:hypothetical protein
MANWYALDGGDTVGNVYDVAYMIPIPSVNNRAGKNYRTVLIASGVGGFSTVPSTIIDPADLTAIQNGSIFEFHEKFYTDPTQNLAALSAAVTARFNQLTSIVQTALQNRLAYYGGSA